MSKSLCGGVVWWCGVVVVGQPTTWSLQLEVGLSWAVTINDFITDVDGSLIPPRTNPDKIKNSHADSFIPFLKDSRSVILNGRITPVFNNYTFITTRGCSVPDYMFCPLSEIDLCREIKILPVSDIVNCSGIRPPRNLPDHSIIMGTFVTSHFETEQQEFLTFPTNSPTNYPNNNPTNIPTNSFTTSFTNSFTNSSTNNYSNNIK